MAFLQVEAWYRTANRQTRALRMYQTPKHKVHYHHIVLTSGIHQPTLILQPYASNPKLSVEHRCRQ